jgi:hypothetical protein
MDLSAVRGTELEELEFAESLFINHGNNPINIEQRLERTIEPGEYSVMLADDHDDQKFISMGTQNLCFPHTLLFKVFPLTASAPFILSILPNPTVPIVQGMDLVITIKFSEPPDVTAETIAELVTYVFS